MHGYMLSSQALFALTYVPLISLIAIYIVAAKNNKSRTQKWYGFLGIICFSNAVVAHIFFLIKLLSN